MILFVCIAFPPLAIYLIWIGLLNLSRRPRLLSGTQDVRRLGWALSGLAVAGPLELFLPETAAFRFGPWVWVLLIALYILTVILISMITQPRLVVYNATLEQLRPVIAEVGRRIDGEARWAGESIVLPKLGVRMHFDTYTPSRNIQLVASGREQEIDGWHRLERELRKSLRNVRGERGMHGLQYLMTGLLFLVTTGVFFFRDYPSFATAVREMLRI